MNLYAIKHTPTDAFMPARMFRRGSGWSWWEPTETRAGYTPYDANPRLFFTLPSARNALTAWLRGPLSRQEVDGGPVDCSSPFPQHERHTEVLPAGGVSRPRSEMLIVPFILTPRNPA